jgi:thioredoxin 1
MPTFVILKNGKEADRIQGADRAALTAAVGRAVKDARKVTGFAGAGKGYTLGGSASPAPPRAAAAAARGGSAGWMGGAGKLNVDAVVRFVALYGVSLFSLDAIKSAAECRFAVQTEGPGTQAGRRMGS